MRQVIRRLVISCFAALVLAAPACAGTIIVKLTFVPGKLAAKSLPVAVGAGETVQIPVTVADGRGSGTGWTLSFAAGQNLTVTGITARCAANSTCTLPAAAERPGGATVLQAARGTGMGVMHLVVTVAASTNSNVAFRIASV
jgi:hypothetical protein